MNPRGQIGHYSESFTYVCKFQLEFCEQATFNKATKQMEENMWKVIDNSPCWLHMEILTIYKQYFILPNWKKI